MRAGDRGGATYKERADQRQPTDGDRQNERLPDGKIVRQQHALQLTGRGDLADVGGAGADDGGGVEALGEFGDLLDELVGEDVLRDGDGEGAAEGVEEDRDRV